MDSKSLRDRSLGEKLFGEIPDQWEYRKLSYGINIKGGQVDPTEEPYSLMPLIAPNHIESETGRITGIESAEEQGARSGKYLCERGNVIYSKIRPELAKAAVAPKRCLCSADMYPIDGHPTYRNQFLAWLFISTPFTRWVSVQSQRVAMPKVNRETLSRLRVPTPPIEEQDRIVTYLDQKTSDIDESLEYIKSIENKLEERRLVKIREEVTHSADDHTGSKETGIPWLGKIPEEWGVAKIGWKYDIQLGKMLDESERSGKNPRPYLRNKDVQWWKIDTEDLPKMDFSPEEQQKYQLEQGDVLVCEGGEAGRSAIWEGSSEEIYYQKALHRVRPISEDQVPEFFCYFMEFAVKSGLFSSRANQSTIEHVTVEKLSGQKIPIPPKEQQERISKSLSESIQNINDSLATVRKLRGILKEKRQALITAAVTGQIDMSKEKGVIQGDD
jgi:type I restriction enzyme S subunit